MKAGFILMLLLILATNVYIVWRMYQILPTPWLKIAVPTLYALTLLTYIGCFIGMIGGRTWPVRVSSVLTPILIIYLYSLICFLVIDFGRLVHLIPEDFIHNSAKASAAVFGAVAILLITGAANYRIKHRESLEITTEKQLEKPLKIVMASDLHLGYTNSRKTLAKWVDMFNAEHPDLIIFGGDLIDNSVKPLFEDNFAEEFHRLQAPACAVFGNHEFISGAGPSEKFYEDAGITLLRDTVINIHGITLIGREDRSGAGHPADSSHARRPLADLTEGVSPDSFTILIDHQPYHLEEAQDANVDFQFSGHTHGGQVWPLTALINLMYEKAWGHHQRGSTRYYISSGLGIWGPKIRLGSRSEYLVLTVSGKVSAQIPEP